MPELSALEDLMNEASRLALAPPRFRQHLAKEVGEFRTILFFACTLFFPVLFGCATNDPSSNQAAGLEQSNAGYSFTYTNTIATASETVQRVGTFLSLNPDCTPEGYPKIVVLTAPAHGTLSFEQGTAYSNYAKDDQKYDCNKHPSPATLVYYQSHPGYVGSDVAMIATTYPRGWSTKTTYNLIVK
jgi:hypothetical protein